MNFLIAKSEQNRIAVTHLKDVGLYAPSIHCGYYSCLQKIIGILMEYYPDIYEGSYKVEGSRGNTHPYYIREFSNKIRREFKNKEDARNIKNYLFDLKALREESDYSNMEVLVDKVEKVQERTDNFHKIIKKHMKI